MYYVLLFYGGQPPLLYQHVISKHEAGTDPASCFAQLAGYDPNDKGDKAAATKAAPVKKKKAGGDAALDDLLNAGLKKK